MAASQHIAAPRTASQVLVQEVFAITRVAIRRTSSSSNHFTSAVPFSYGVLLSPQFVTLIAEVMDLV
jgi:hypothetical protein